MALPWRPLGWTAAVFGSAYLTAWTFSPALASGGAGMTRLFAVGATIGSVWGLWRYVTAGDRALASFVEQFGTEPAAGQVISAGGRDLSHVSRAIERSMGRLAARREQQAEELAVMQAIIDDLPIALLLVEPGGRTILASRMAREMFRERGSERAEGFAAISAELAALLQTPTSAETLITLSLSGRTERALVRSALVRGRTGDIHVVAVEPLQRSLDIAEVSAQSDLVRVVTHEVLNTLTPLTSLTETALELLEDEHAARDERLDEARDAVAIVARRAKSLSSFVQAYRTVAKLPSVRADWLSAGSLFDEVGRLTKAKWPAIRIEVAVDPSELRIWGDADLISQSLLNLAENGAIATREAAAPTLWLSAGAAPGGHCWLEVADNGAGVPEPLRRDIFLPFFTTRRDGTGVGLSFVRHAIVAHGGTIEVGERTGGGAAFRINL